MNLNSNQDEEASAVTEVDRPGLMGSPSYGLDQLQLIISSLLSPLLLPSSHCSRPHLIVTKNFFSGRQEPPYLVGLL